MRIPLLASCALAAAGCFVGIDTSLMNRDAGVPHADGGPPPDATTGDDGDGGANGGDAGAPDPSLVGSWSFEQIDGSSVHDDSGHGHDGTLLAAASSVNGVSGKGLAMDGSQRFDVPSLEAASFPATGTYSMWFEFTAATLPNPGKWGLFDVHDTSSGRAHWSLQQLPNGDEPIDIDFVNVDGRPSVNDVFFANGGPWNHVVVTWDVTGYAVYSGDQGRPLRSVSSGSYDFPFSPSGQQFRVGTAFQGAIDEIRLYSRPFSASEVGGIP